MKPINVYADVHGHIGYAVHARAFVTALSELRPVCLIPKSGKLPDPLPEGLIPSIQNLSSFDLKATSINLDFAGVDLCRFAGKKQIIYTVFETTKLSPLAVSIMNQVEQVWTPTQWGQKILHENGVASTRTRVVPEGVDATIYHPQVSPLNSVYSLGGTRFLAIGKWEERKQPWKILQAFDEAFPGNEDVWLVTHFNSPVEVLRHISIEDEINKLNLRRRDRIVIVNDRLDSDAAMASLYTSCHAFVSASRAEGWGLPMIEAMASGLPVISPRYSGPTEFLTDDTAYLFDVTQYEDVHCPVFFPFRGQYGVWANFDVVPLAERMRAVFSDRAGAAEKGRRGAVDAASKWTWRSAAKTAHQSLG